MLTPTEFINLWGGNQLFRFPPDLLQSIDIPNDAKKFLVEVGLPLKAETPLGIYSVPLPLTIENPPSPGARHTLLSHSPFVTSRYRLLTILLDLDHYWGESYNIFFAVEEVTGKVWLVGPSRMTDPYKHDSFEEPNLFVNSSISQLAESLLEYRDFVKHFVPTEPAPEEVQRLIAVLEERWQQIDPEAMANQEYRWPMMIYNMREHL